MPPSSLPSAPLSVSVQQQPTPLQQLSGPLVIQRRSATQATVDLPPGKKAIGVRYVFRRKTDKEDKVVQHKVRLVAKGYTQEPEKDYDQVFAPVGKLTSGRVLLAEAAVKGWHVQQEDVDHAYLNAVLQEEVYVRQPEGFDDGTGRVYRLHKALYGLKQAPRAWNEEISTTLIAAEFDRSACDEALYIRFVDEEPVYVLVYVDDLLLVSPRLELIDQVKEVLAQRYQMKDLGEVSTYLGVEVRRSVKDGWLEIGQEKYVRDLQGRFGDLLKETHRYACMHDHEVHDLEECMLVDADGGAHGLDFCLMGQVHQPKSVKEALSRPEWVESMREELESHKVNESFELVDPACVPPGMEVFTPVGKPTTLRGSLGMAASSGFHIHHMDVTTTYLLGVLKEELYMRQPPGFDDGSGRVCRLKKSIYGLKQAPRQWYLKFDEALMDFGFERSECDPALYHLVRDEGRLSLYLYVDDILLMSSSMVLLDEVKGLLSSRFRMKDLGEAKYYLGVQIERDESGILIHQERYILNMLESFGLSEANPVRNPLPTGFDVHAHAEEPLLRDELVQLYQSIVGSLMYASTTTQPQIAYAVSQLSKVVSCPKAFHLHAAKRVLSDATISWQSKRQPVVALSTTESEYISLCQCIQEGVWLKRLFGEFGHDLAGGMPVFVDNQSAIALAQNACLHGRTKHMRVRWHFIREMVASGEVILRWCPTNRQAADILTKPLPFERHGVCMSLMGLQPHVGMVPEQDVGGLVLLYLDDIMLWTAPLPGQGGVE
ncbi:unnamed protein product [Closterium sp. NIES-53]